jgi:hypothetical protein
MAHYLYNLTIIGGGSGGLLPHASRLPWVRTSCSSIKSTWAEVNMSGRHSSLMSQMNDPTRMTQKTMATVSKNPWRPCSAGSCHAGTRARLYSISL